MTNYFTPGQPYSYATDQGVWQVPSQQTLPPATADDLAFRPACEQLTAVVQANGKTAFVWISRMMTELPTNSISSNQQAWFELDAMGVCKIGGVKVPQVAVDRLPTPAIAEPTVAGEQVSGIPGASAEPSMVMVGGGLVLVLAAVGVMGSVFLRRTKSTPQQKTNEQSSALQQLTSLLAEED